ncbi:MAG: polysaccharide export protein, partial [Paramuribaculum sp.]|nr:polysaccharide export protein [Paramuribaculum sp.]
PRTVEVKSERFSIFDALASAGDMTEYGRRDNVTVIRETPEGLVYHRLDLTNPDVISSPYYYLHQNDVVIVDPNRVRESNARYNTNNSYKLSVISTIVSAVSVIASLVIALAVR